MTEAAATDRPTREQWVDLRRAQGRATPADWRETSVLLGYQAEIVRQCEHNDVVVVEKSRRTGATWGAAADAVLRSASSRSDGGMDTLYMGTSHDMAKEFIDAAANWSRLFDKSIVGTSDTIFDDGSDKGVQALKIDFASGFSIVALSSKPRSLRGRQGFAVLDEAAFVDNLAELIKAAMAFLIWGGKVLIISTHNGADNPFNLLITDIRAGRLRYGIVRFDLDEALRDGLFERICLINGHKHGEWTPEKEADWREKLISDYGDGADEELYCIPSQGSGAWLPGPLIEARMHDAPVLRLGFPDSFTMEPEHRRKAEVQRWIEEELLPVMRSTLDPALQTGFGMDIGRYRDLTVICPMQITRVMRRIVPFLVELSKVPFQQQEQIRDAVVSGLPRFIGGRTDATGIGASLGESGMQKFGASMVPVKFSAEWYRIEMPPVKAAFEDDAIGIPRDAEVSADLRAFKIVKGIATLPNLRVGAAAGGTRHGDAGIAIVLAYSATRMPFVPYKPVARIAEAAGLKPEASADDVVTHLQAKLPAGAKVDAVKVGLKAAGLDFDAASAEQITAHFKSTGTGDAELRSTVISLQSQLTTLQTDTAKEKATAFIDKAIADGKPIKPIRDHYIARHQKDAAAVETEINALVSIHSGTVKQPRSSEAGALDADESAIVSLMGLDPKKFAETKAELDKTAL